MSSGIFECCEYCIGSKFLSVSYNNGLAGDCGDINDTVFMFSVIYRSENGNTLDNQLQKWQKCSGKSTATWSCPITAWYVAGSPWVKPSIVVEKLSRNTKQISKNIRYLHELFCIRLSFSFGLLVSFRDLRDHHDQGEHRLKVVLSLYVIMVMQHLRKWSRHTSLSCSFRFASLSVKILRSMLIT